MVMMKKIRELKTWWDNIPDEKFERAVRIGFWLDAIALVVIVATVLIVDALLKKAGY